MFRSGKPKEWKLVEARKAIVAGDFDLALSHISRSCFGAGYNVEYFELLGRALLGADQVVNAGRFLFVSGARNPEYAAAISQFITQNHNPNNFRQLQSQLPQRVRVFWLLSQFPSVVANELRELGWPENTQSAIISRKLVPNYAIKVTAE